MSNKWYVSRQKYLTDEENEYVVEIAGGGSDYANPDQLVSAWPRLGEGKEYADPREALAAALAVKNAWEKRDARLDIRIEHGHTGGYTLPFSGFPTNAQLKDWADNEYTRLHKCDQCGEIIESGPWVSAEWDDIKFCSEHHCQQWHAEQTAYCYNCDAEATHALNRQDGHTSYMCRTCGEAFKYGQVYHTGQLEEL